MVLTTISSFGSSVMPFSTEQHCGHCQRLTHLKFVWAKSFFAREPRPHTEVRGFSLEILKDEDEVDAYAAALCSLCNRPNLVLFTAQRSHVENISKNVDQPEPLFGGQSLITVKRVLPSLPRAGDHPSWGPKISELFVDAQAMAHERRSPTIIITTLRTVLDLATKDLGAGDGTLQQKIRALRINGIITQGIADWADRIRLLGNVAVHEAEAERTEVDELVDFTRMLLDMCFTLPATISAKGAAKV